MYRGPQDPEYIISYLEQQRVFTDVQLVDQLRRGASGAKVYRVCDGTGCYVVKHTPPYCGEDQQLLSSYQREWKFYSTVHHDTVPMIPQVLYIQNDPEIGIVLVFPYYQGIEFSEWNTDLQYQAADLCAQIHSLDPTWFSDLKLTFNKTEVDPERLAQAFENWTLVLAQHGQNQDTVLRTIQDHMTAICKILNAPPHQICHGDFHADNILRDDERLVVCDWQNINMGKGAGDIAFFISRAKSAGIDINTAQLIDYYCKRLSCYTGERINSSEIYQVINASTVFTSFLFWPNYLKNAPSDKVFTIYNEMAAAFHRLEF